MATKTKTACQWSCEKLVAGCKNAYLWTFTMEGYYIDFEMISHAWARFRTILKDEGFKLQCVRVFEPHPGGHGWHVHFLTGKRYDVKEIRPMAEKAGFGRINAKSIPADAAQYIAKYLTKAKRGDAHKGKRLWACVGFKGVKVVDVISSGDLVDAVRERQKTMLEGALESQKKKIRYMAFLITLAEFTTQEAMMYRRFREGTARELEIRWVYEQGIA